MLINGGSSNTIGGANAGGTAPGNQISGNSASGAGVLIQGVSQNNVILGNLIGTDAAGSGPLPNLVGVRIRTGGMGNTVGGDAMVGEGNVISGNASDGVLIRDTDGTNIFGNLIGTTASGGGDLGNGDDGVEIVNSQNINVGGTGQGQGNVISGNTEAGVRINSGGVTVQANRIGTDEAGTAAMPNDVGVLITGTGNTIGGDSTAGEGNQISGNADAGVRITDSAATGNMVLGNLIGTDAAGTGGLGNKFGVIIDDAPSNTVGGATTGDGNTISGNMLHGVFLQNPGTFNTQVYGNNIGTNLAGTAAVPNGANGVLIDQASSSVIGNTENPGQGNVISGNTLDGIKISESISSFAQVAGNAIGIDAAGTTPIPNRNGVLIASNTSVTFVFDNTIAHNNFRGVWINSNAGTQNEILPNSIHDNGGLGIDLGLSGITPNDVGDGDAGANNLQNFPEIQSVVLNGASLDVTFLVDSTPGNSAYPLEVNFYIADSNNEEGETWLGSAEYVEGVAGTAVTVSIPTGTATVGTNIVATARDSNSNTSEFSAPATVAAMLQAAGGESSGGAAVSARELAPIVDAAVVRLANLGLDASLLATIDVSIADLPGAALGLAAHSSITIDVNAAGHGWFIDATPMEDSEFSNPQSAIRIPQSMDLLTAVMHELGHAAGLHDQHDTGDEEDLMFGWLEAGLRRTSFDASRSDNAFASLAEE